MTDKKLPSIVLSLRTSLGEDILGYYCGETEKDDSFEKCVILYRPVKIKEQLYQYQKTGKIVTQYVTNLYLPFGSSMVYIPYSQILNRSEASVFFDIFYKKTLGELIATEEDAQAAYLKFWNDQDTADAMSDTDSILVTADSEYLQ
jgi:hypothetical protein